MPGINQHHRWGSRSVPSSTKLHIAGFVHQAPSLASTFCQCWFFTAKHLNWVYDFFFFQIPFLRDGIALGPLTYLYASILHSYENHTQIFMWGTWNSTACLDLCWPVLSLPALYNYTNTKLIKRSWNFLCFYLYGCAMMLMVDPHLTEAVNPNQVRNSVYIIIPENWTLADDCVRADGICARWLSSVHV